MANQWYIALEEKPLGPFDDKNIENMLKNRTIHFVDFVWSDEQKEWKRVFEVGGFNHLLPKRPKIDMSEQKDEVINFQAAQEFIQKREQQAPPAPEPIKIKPQVKEPEEEVKPKKVSKEAPTEEIKIQEPKEEPKAEAKDEKYLNIVRSFVADVIIHDNFKVFHGVVYGLSHNELFVACKSLDIPVDKTLKLLISSEQFDQMFELNGKVRAISKFSPIGYSIVLEEMPKEFKKLL